MTRRRRYERIGRAFQNKLTPTQITCTPSGYRARGPKNMLGKLIQKMFRSS
jgi:hypothetical protein